LLAFDGDMAVGWCQLTPRDALLWLDRAWRLKRADDVPVWSLSCFYVRWAGHHFSADLSGFEAAKRATASALEADPLDASRHRAATGYASTFARWV